MKKLLAILLAGCTFIACKNENKDNRRLIDGPDPTYTDAFVLETDQLVMAHRYVFEMPAQGGEYELKIVSAGISHPSAVEVSAGSFDTELLTLFGNAEVYDYIDVLRGPLGNMTTVQEPRYLQTIRIVVQANATAKERSAILTVRTMGGLEGGLAEISLRQAGAK